MTKFKEGDRVVAKCGGKISRLEGVAGKWMPGTVVEEQREAGGEHWVVVKLDHRQQENSPDFSFQMDGLFDPQDVRLA